VSGAKYVERSIRHEFAPQIASQRRGARAAARNIANDERDSSQRRATDNSRPTFKSCEQRANAANVATICSSVSDGSCEPRREASGAWSGDESSVALLGAVVVAASAARIDAVSLDV
jgi:hypothetical protein